MSHIVNVYMIYWYHFIRVTDLILFGDLTQNTNQIQNIEPIFFCQKISNFVFLTFELYLPPWVDKKLHKDRIVMPNSNKMLFCKEIKILEL